MMPARNSHHSLVQLLALYTDPACYNVQEDTSYSLFQTLLLQDVSFSRNATHSEIPNRRNFSRLEWPWAAWSRDHGHSRRGIFGCSVLQLYSRSYAVRSAFLATAATLPVLLATQTTQPAVHADTCEDNSVGFFTFIRQVAHVQVHAPVQCAA